MSDRARVLARLRSVSVPPVDLPELACEWTMIADKAESFASMLDAVGGRCERVATESGLADAVGRLAKELDADQVCCEIERIAPAFAAPDAACPQDFAGLDLSIVRGEVAVAENGAVWVTDAAVRDRAILFLAQHVALVVDRDVLVGNMHEAYERIEIAARPFGVFVSGPSKTADIEQALVIGAQGPRSLTVFLVG